MVSDNHGVCLGGINFSFTARVLLQSSQWRKCLRQIYNGEPIMNEIIRRMPGSVATTTLLLLNFIFNTCLSEVAVDVLDRSTVQRSKTHDEEGCIAFNFEFLECFNEKK